MSLTADKFTNECQIAMKWRIKEEYLRQTLNDNKLIISDSFNASNIPGLQYYLYLRKDDSRSNKVVVGLRLRFGMTKKITANFTVSIRSASYHEKSVNKLYEESGGWSRLVCNVEELFDPEKKFFVNGVMEIELEGTLKSQGIKRKASEPLRLAKILWDDDPGKDITVVVEDQQIKVHKWVLCANSPVFKAEMESNMIEAQEKKITITDFTLEIVKLAIEYCYEQDIKERIDDENVSKLLQFSDKYNIEPLHDLLQNILIDKLSEANVCSYANMTVTSNALELREYCIAFLMAFVGKNIVIDGFANLDKEITSEMGRRCFFSTSVSK